MRKINSLFSDNHELKSISQNVKSHQRLQQLWQAAAHKLLADASFASNLSNGQLTVYADSSIIASKIKLTQASLLTQLHNLQINEPLFRECKVTSIVAKVQVKSRPKPVIKTPRKLTPRAAASLKTFAQNLGDSPLATKLRNLAEKT
jgi:Dna[CI] antecedent, DciA